jgi:hypothetical protein
MDGTFGADRFPFLKGAFFETQVCIIEKPSALSAEIAPCAVMIAAINAYHGLYGLAFPRHPGMGVALHVNSSLCVSNHSRDILT